ncbi:MAG: hypothetical protein IJ653_07115 [Bacteroidales bacterium]|nr:hypothetical protein [Bacteroidales bacterium]
MKTKGKTFIVLIILSVACGIVVSKVQAFKESFFEENLQALTRGEGVDLEFCRFEISEPTEYDFLTAENSCREGTDQYVKKQCDFKWAYYELNNGGKCFVK